MVLGKPILTPSTQFHYIRTLLHAAQHPSSLALLDCWHELERNGGMRMGRDIPSRALARLLPNILIAEPNEAFDDARIRLAGTALIERFGRDIAGELATQVFTDDPDGAALLLEEARKTAQTRTPGLIDTRIAVNDAQVMHLETVLLPIQSPDGKAFWTLVGAFRF